MNAPPRRTAGRPGRVTVEPYRAAERHHGRTVTFFTVMANRKDGPPPPRLQSMEDRRDACHGRQHRNGPRGGGGPNRSLPRAGRVRHGHGSAVMVEPVEPSQNRHRHRTPRVTLHGHRSHGESSRPNLDGNSPGRRLHHAEQQKTPLRARRRALTADRVNSVKMSGRGESR